MHGHGTAADGGQHTKVLGLQDCSGAEHGLAAAHLARSAENVLSRPRRLVVDLDTIAVEQAGALDHDHGVRTLRDGRSSHDARRLAGCKSELRGLAGRDLLDHMQDAAPFLQVLAADRVAVHQGLVERRHVDVTGDVFCQHQPQGSSR